MPLPPAPTKRAALLSPGALDAPARSPSRVARKMEIVEPAQKPPVLNLFDSRTADGSEHPVIYKGKMPASRGKMHTESPKKESIPQLQPVVIPKKSRHAGPGKLFVLDTNVLMHDPMCLFRFEEHDIFLPMIVLEELDSHKKGMTEVARNARQTSRSLDALAAAQGADITAGLKLDTTGHREAGGKLFFQTRPLNYTLPTSLPQGKADNQILGVVEALRHLHSPQGQEGQPTREVVLVSKDINMRVKARALGLTAEDYQNDKTLEDGDLLYSGALALPADFWTKNGKSVESWQSGSHTYYR